MFLLFQIYPTLIQLEGIQLYLLITGVLSLLMGSIPLLSQLQLKRFLAYSSVGNIGLLLLGFGVSFLHGSILFVIIYMITVLN